MISRLLFLFLLIFSTSRAFSQGQAWNWLIGDSVGIHFVNGKYPVNTNKFRVIYQSEGNATISDEQGNLLFYGSAHYIFDSSGNILNSDPLAGDISSAQPLLFAKHKKSSLFYAFTTGTAIGKDSFCYNLINSNGQILLENKKLVQRASEKLSSVYHKNGKNIWVLTHGAFSDSLFTYLIDSTGLINCPVVNKIGAIQGPDWALTQGCMKFSPNGKMLSFISSWPGNRVEIFRFNDETGELSNPIALSCTAPYSIEFSNDSKKLYVIGNFHKNLYQFNLEDYSQVSIQNSLSSIYLDTNEYFQQLQLAPDKKIYLSLGDHFYLSVINNPDSLGTACNFQYYGYNVGKYKDDNGLPNFNQSYFYTPSADFSYEMNCINNSIRFEATDTIGANNYSWRFRHLSSGSTQSNTGQSITQVFVDTGVYEVRLIAVNGSRNDTVIKTVTLHPKLVPGFLGKDTFYCSDNPVTFTLQTPPNLHCIEWQDGSSSTTFQADTAGTYIVNICNNAFCRLSDTIVIAEHFSPAKPHIEQHHDTLVCDVTDADTYTWTKDGNLITGDTSFLKITQIGKYRVTIGKDGCSKQSDTLSVTQVGVKEILKGNLHVSIYPNPAKDVIYVDAKVAGNYQVELYDMTGRIIYNGTFEGVTVHAVPLDRINSHVYFVRISKNGLLLGNQAVIIE